MSDTNTMLDELDLEKLTGYKQAAAQVRWLRENGIRFTLDRHGKPRTTLGLYEKALTTGQRDNGYTSPK